MTTTAVLGAGMVAFGASAPAVTGILDAEVVALATGSAGAASAALGAVAGLHTNGAESGHQLSAVRSGLRTAGLASAGTGLADLPGIGAAYDDLAARLDRLAGPRASRGQPHRAPAPAWVRPGTGYLTSGFGMRWGRMHKGIDLAAPWGAPIYAAGDGVVVEAGSASGYGNLIVIEHAPGIQTAYGHEARILVKKGQRVHAGELIARVGSLGDSTGPHLHFEVRIMGRPINPVPWLERRGISV